MAASQGFIVTPSSRIWIIGHSTTFECQHSTADTVGWRVNGTSLGDIHNDNFRFNSNMRNGSVVHFLTIANPSPADNHTTIECVAAFLENSEQEISPHAELILQGWCNNDNYL